MERKIFYWKDSFVSWRVFEKDERFKNDKMNVNNSEATWLFFNLENLDQVNALERIESGD